MRCNSSDRLIFMLSFNLSTHLCWVGITLWHSLRSSSHPHSERLYSNIDRLSSLISLFICFFPSFVLSHGRVQRAGSVMQTQVDWSQRRHFSTDKSWQQLHWTGWVSSILPQVKLLVMKEIWDQERLCIMFLRNAMLFFDWVFTLTTYRPHLNWD